MKQSSPRKAPLLTLRHALAAQARHSGIYLKALAKWLFCALLTGGVCGLLGTLGGGNAVIAPIMLPIMAPAVRRRPRAAVATGLVLCISLAFSTKSLVDAAKILTWLPAPEACTI